VLFVDEPTCAGSIARTRREQDHADDPSTSHRRSED
jgi:hypothetical protein